MTIVSEEQVTPDEIIASLELLMFGAVGMTTLALSAATPDAELTLSQWRALVVIDRAPARVGEIATAVGVSLPSASRLVQRLERRGLVTTERDEVDRRATLVRMTAKGHELTKEVVDRRRALMKAALATHAPRLPRSLTGGLAVIARAFERYE